MPQTAMTACPATTASIAMSKGAFVASPGGRPRHVATGPSASVPAMWTRTATRTCLLHAYGFNGPSRRPAPHAQRGRQAEGPYGRALASSPSATSMWPSPTSAATAGSDLIQLNPDRCASASGPAPAIARSTRPRSPSPGAVAVGDASGDGKADIYIVRGTDNVEPARPAAGEPGRRHSLQSRSRSRRRRRARRTTSSPSTTTRTATTDFVVLNGRNKAGPVQLLAPFPRS